MKTIHKGTRESKRLKCDKCEKKFNKKETFHKHVETVHKSKGESNTNTNLNSTGETSEMTFQRNLRSLQKKNSARDPNIN